MKILVINADCLLRNSSANLCHLAYIKGMIDAGYDVSLLHADGKEYILDQEMKIPDEVRCYTINGVSLYEKISLFKQRRKNSINSITENHTNVNYSTKSSSKGRFVKKIVKSAYGPHGIYKTFVNKAKNFELNDSFDYLISVSTPPASHLLAYLLLQKKKIKAKRWIQIWEDPWYSDAYGYNKDKSVYKEEKRLLSVADKVCYVSPLTLKKQQALYKDYSDKMFWEPLPAYYENTDYCSDLNNCYGYFGDYMPTVRNINPFYEAAKKTNIDVYVCGNPYGLLKKTNKINIYPRLPLNELHLIEQKVNILVFLCNCRGGQIPGKIYQYSATRKTILFILDGTEEEKKVIKDYFSKYNRYVFCDNTEEDIILSINRIENQKDIAVCNKPLTCFSPEKIVERIVFDVGD